MDSVRFDSIARALGAAATRRAGIGGALAALASRLLPQVADAATEPEPEGPCGKKGKANRCHKHSQCCTGYCRKKKGKKGRCRCAPAKVTCTKKTICCDGLTCSDGKCTAVAACDVCASGCSFDSVNAAYAAAADGATITIDSGTWPTGIMLDKTITLEACGGADGVILTPDGTQQTEDSYFAIITDDGTGTTPLTLTLVGLELLGTGVGSAESLVATFGPVTVNADGCTISEAAGGMWIYSDGNHSLTNTTISGCSYGLYFELDSGNITIDDCVIEGNDSYGLYLDAPTAPATRANVTVTITNSIFRNNANTGVYLLGGVSSITGGSITGNGGADYYGGLGLFSGTLVVTDVEISGNTDTEWGGGIYVYAETESSSLTLAGTTTVTGNTADVAAGVGAEITSPNTVTITGTSTRVSGNINTDPTQNWQCATKTDSGSWIEVAGCSFQ